MSSKHPLIFLLLLAVSLSAGDARAGAWTQKKGKGQLITTASYYHNSSYYDDSGTRQTSPNYRKYELNPYAEYGLRDGLTVGTNIFLQSAQQSASATKSQRQSYGLGDSEFFARARLYEKDGFALAIEPMIKLPSPSAYLEPAIGSKHTNIGATLSGGYGFSAHGRNHFVDIGAGYIERFGTPKNQLKFSGTLGISTSQNWMILTQIFQTHRTDKSTVSPFTQSSSDDYNLTQLQLSAIYSLSEKNSIQFGGFSNISGRNTGNGDGVLFAFRRNF